MAISPQLAFYQQRLMSLKRSRHLDWPAHVHLETFARCNARCDFCPSSTLERSGVRMPDALIEKIIRELEEMPRDLPFQLSPFKVNEPFLDRRLLDVLHRINDRLPQAEITLTTNASPLTRNQLLQLGRVKNLGYLWISLNEYRPELYERVMGLDFGKVVERLDLVHAMLGSRELTFRVVVSRVADGSEEDEAFSRWVQGRWPGFQVSLFQRGGWLGQVNVATGAVPDVGCLRWFDLSITATGVVAHCCMDGTAAHPIGDVNHQHVLEVYDASAYRVLRMRMESRLTVMPCRLCTFL
ncbi:MAG: radical SAM/SPASM domain-containing protein [Magnetococcales bacterium]|nr:radical SAM/SPASM domain-containing protein [Magnetococcales bacterium]